MRLQIAKPIGVLPETGHAIDGAIHYRVIYRKAVCFRGLPADRFQHYYIAREWISDKWTEA
jgi:hypothetical protein